MADQQPLYLFDDLVSDTFLAGNCELSRRITTQQRYPLCTIIQILVNCALRERGYL